jgi:dihydroxyacetone kinase-like predicted kinase
MVHINEELKAAKAAKAAIDVLLTATPKSTVLGALKKAKYAAVLNLSSGGALNEARGNVGIALSNVIHGMPTEEKIDKAKVAIDVWMRELEATKPEA